MPGLYRSHEDGRSGLARERWHEGVFAVVGILARAKVAYCREEGVPEEGVDQKIADESNRCPEFCPVGHESAGRVEGRDQMRSGRSKHMRDSAPQRAVRQIDFRLEQEDGADHSQNKGPKNF